MQTAPDAPKSLAAAPALNFESAAQWEAQKPDVLEALQSQIYGQIPPSPSSSVQYSQRLIKQGAFNNSANIYEWSVTLRADIAPITMVIVKPVNQDPDARSPLILAQNFCPNHNVVPVDGISEPRRNSFSCEGEGMLAAAFKYFFGRYITTPPIERIAQRGYALAVVYPPDFVPDNLEAAAPILEMLSDSSDNRLGAIGAWAWQASRLVDALDDSGEFTDVITYGHSRYGKSALVAAAFDPRIDGVIAHQSGTGGASLSINKPGESVAAITQTYPHWFTPAYNEASLTLDQHYLLAAIAPRPVFLGNAKRDVWSDPEGAFRAGQSANSIYGLYGSKGLSQRRLTEFDPAADIAFWMRPGTHGVTQEDWPAFLNFLDAHFK